MWNIWDKLHNLGCKNACSFDDPDLSTYACSFNWASLFVLKTKSTYNQVQKDRGPYGENVGQTLTFRDLAAATTNFSRECFLGEGGFGSFYRGCPQGSYLYVFLFYFSMLSIPFLK